MQIVKAIHLEDPGKTMNDVQDASEDIRDGCIMFPSLKTSYMEGNTQKDEETGDYAQENTMIRPGHAPCA